MMKTLERGRFAAVEGLALGAQILYQLAEPARRAAPTDRPE
jgi:hypothetical protein